MPPIEPLEARRLLSVGQLDQNFHALFIPNEPFVSTTTASKSLPDGRILVARVTEPDGKGHLVVTRYLSGGTIDTTFGGTGGQPAGSIAPATFNHFRPQDIDIDSSGRIYLAGGNEIVRLTSGGTLDVTFGGTAHGMPVNTPAGMAVVSNEVGGGEITDIALAGDGRVGVVGTSFNHDAWCAAFNSEGSSIAALNFVFLRSTTDTIPETTTFGAANAVAFTSDGGMLVGGLTGSRRLDAPTQISWDLFKIKADGTQAWKWNGPTNITQSGGVGGLAVEPDGSILVQGSQDPIVARLTSTGTLDSTFGTNGTTATSIAGVNEIGLLPDGRFYLLSDSASLIRMTADGHIDPVFPSVSVPADPGYGPIELDLVGDDPLVSSFTRHVDQSDGINDDFQLHRITGGVSALRNSKGTLQVQGTSGDDVIGITRRHRDNRIVVRINGDSLVQSFPPKPVKRIQAFGFGGDDSITIGADLPYIGYIDAGSGNDTLNGGDAADTLIGGAGNDRIFGNAGNDQLFGNGGHDTLHGGDGDDQLFGGPNAADKIFGDAGNDSAAEDSLDSYDSVDHLLA